MSVTLRSHSNANMHSRPIITFIIILLLPSILTFLTLLIHRVRAARAAQRDRAPEDIVHNLPWQVWTGKGWEKHEGGEGLSNPSPPKDLSPPPDLERGNPEGETTRASTSRPRPHQWFEDQAECAICLCEFAKGDKVRVLPCHHIFHLDEVDEWLIQRKKLCPVCKADVTLPHIPPQPHVEPSATQSLEAPVELATERTPLLNNSSHRPDTYDSTT